MGSIYEVNPMHRRRRGEGKEGDETAYKDRYIERREGREK